MRVVERLLLFFFFSFSGVTMPRRAITRDNRPKSRPGPRAASAVVGAASSFPGVHVMREARLRSVFAELDPDRGVIVRFLGLNVRSTLRE